MQNRILYLFFLFLPVVADGQDLIPFRVGNQWGYSDTAGRMVFTIQYDQAEPFNEGFARVIKGQQMALINTKNEQVIPFAEQLIVEIYKGSCIKVIRKESSTVFGVVTTQNKILIPFLYDYISREQEFFEVKKGQSYGRFTVSGKQVLEPVYDFIDQKDNFFYVRKGNTMGLFTLDGKQVTPIKYMVIGQFREGLSKSRQGDKFGFLDKKGKEAIPFEYDLCSPFSEGYAEVMQHTPTGWKSGLINQSGKKVIPFEFESIGAFQSGIAKAKRNGLWGLIDTKGNSLTPFEFDRIERAYMGATACRKNQKWFLFNSSEKKFTPSEYDSVSIIENDEEHVLDFGLKPYKNDRDYILVSVNNKWGICNKQGREVIPVVYDDVFPFTNGVALVKQNGKWAMADSTGKLITALRYNKLDPYSSSHYFWSDFGVAIYSADSLKRLYGLIDKTGRELTPAAYNYIIPDNRGNFQVLKGKKFGVVNSEGKILIEPKYDAISRQNIPFTIKDALFLNELFLVQMNGKWGYVNASGREFFRD